MMEVQSVSVEEDEEKRLIQLRFDAAVKVIKSLPPDGPFQPSNDMMLKFYSFYKQATVGTCNIARPGFWDAVGKAKWDAWSSLGEMPKEEAMTAYVEEMKLILEGMPMTDEVEELLRVLGPFYELIEEKKKISQISDLSTGFGTMLNSMPSKSVTKSIIRTMEMNGTLPSRPPRLTYRERETSEEEAREEEEEEEEEEDEQEEEEEEEEKVIKEIRKEKKSKKSASRRHKAPMSNGKVLNGGSHLTNGTHCRTTLSSEGGQEDQPVLNGHSTGLDVSGPAHLGSDSDSEVYCDSVDQFGQEENSEHNRSLDELDEEENHVLPAVEEPEADPEFQEEVQEEVQVPPQVIRCGGEEGDNRRTVSQRTRLTAGGTDGSVGRRGRGSRSPGPGSGALQPVYSGDDGDGSRRGGVVTPGGNLNEQIVVALARLQEDMQSVLERLHTLEALTASQARSMSLSPAYAPPAAPTPAAAPLIRKRQKPSWWPFDISPTGLAFAVVWPFVVQWLIRLYLQRRRRRIN